MLYNIIKTVLIDIAAEGSSFYKTKAAEVLYEISISDIENDYKNELESDVVLKSLFESLSFRPAEIIPITINDLPAIIGYPMNATIDAGQEFCYCIEAPTENCILTYGFASKQYDISFRIERIDYPEVLLFQERVLCIDKPYTGSILLDFPGLYKLT